MSILPDIIKQKIREEGPLSFHDFMEMALYYPELGYYTSPGNKIGPKGDYYTSSNITPVFGEMLARQLEEMWQHMGKQEFCIVEYGAGTGLLCSDILHSLSQNKELYDQLNYCIIEKSPVMLEQQRARLGGHVKWYDSIENLPGFSGCILSNELIDNFAVHVVVMEEELMEVFVDYGQEFSEVLLPAREELKVYFQELDIELPRGYKTEVNLESIK